jgi:hypothetical protein
VVGHDLPSDLPPPMRLKPRPLRRASSHIRTSASRGAYTLFYCGVALGVALLCYAGVFLSGPPLPTAQAADNPMRVIATIQLDQSGGKGQCRQVVFDNATGRFEEAGLSRCRNLIPEELLVDTVRSRAGHTDAFVRAFKR